MCAKLPGGPGGDEAGRFAAASGSGVPHHGGSSCAPALPATPSDTTSVASASRSNLRNLPAKGEHLLVRMEGRSRLLMRRRLCTARQDRTCGGLLVPTVRGHLPVAAANTGPFKTA